MPFFQIPESLGGLTQPVAPVDSWSYSSSRHEISQDGQIPFVEFREERNQRLTNDPRQYKRADQTSQNNDQSSNARRSGHHGYPRGCKFELLSPIIYACRPESACTVPVPCKRKCFAVWVYCFEGRVSLSVVLGNTGVTLKAASDVKSLERSSALVLDRNRTLDILRPCQSDLPLIRELRTLLGRGPGGPPLSDRDVIGEIARKIDKREVLAFREARGSGGGGGGGGAFKKVEDDDGGFQPPPPPPRQPSSTSAPPPDSPILASNNDGAAQAVAAHQAAQDGVPFCEH